jgi:hypothetical protein
MGFADLSIVELAEDHHLSVDEVFQLCDRLQISYSNPQTRLALEDVKAIIELIAQEGGSPSS